MDEFEYVTSADHNLRPSVFDLSTLITELVQDVLELAELLRTYMNPRHVCTILHLNKCAVQVEA